jgi:hypothetical protein
MAYIGNDLQVAFPSYRIIDDISGSFNGVLKTFALLIGGTAPVPFPINPQQCLISVNGVIQKPDPSGATGFNLVGTNIVFASAPTAGWAFFGTVLAGADYVNVGANFPDGSVSAPSITFDADTNTGLYRVGADQIGLTCGGVNVGTFTSAGQVFPLGSAAAPSITFAGDTNTGIYSPGADQVAISTNGTGRLFVDSTGRVGVNTSTFADARDSLIVSPAASQTSTFFTVKAGSTSGNGWLFFGDTDSNSVGGIAYEHASDAMAFRTNGSERLRIDSSGRLGLGTSSPTSRLTIKQANDADSTVGTALEANGNDSRLLTYFNTSQDAWITTATYGSTGAFKPLSFWTSDTRRLTIDTAGRVGIGTTSPAATLDISGNQLFSAANPQIQFNAGGPIIRLPSANTLAFLTDSTNERARIDSSGSLLVGTTASRTGRATFVSGTNNINADYQGSAASFVGPGLVGTAANAATISVEDNSAMALGVGGSIGFGGRYLSSSSLYAQWAAIAGKKETVTSGEYGGYLGFYTRIHGSSDLTERMRLTSTGALLIGGTNISTGKFFVSANIPAEAAQRIALFAGIGAGDAILEGIAISKFDNNSTTAQIFQRFYINNGTGGSGQINANGSGAAAFGSFSDARLKENIVDIPSQLQNICSLRPVEFDYKDGSGHQIGFIAQEMEQVYPDAVAQGTDDMLTVTGWSKTEARLVKALQEAIAKIETLEAKVAALEGV